MLNIKKLLTKILERLDRISYLKFRVVDVVLTIPAGSTASPATWTHDFTNDGITGSIWGIIAFLGTVPLPYFRADGTAGTWISKVTGKTVTITNLAGAWNNYHLYALIVFTA